jgi:hypothetical protein
MILDIVPLILAQICQGTAETMKKTTGYITFEVDYPA